jgi:hypothetical protein
MKLSEARFLFDSQMVHDGKILPAKSGDGWVLELSVDDKVAHPRKIHTERGAVRIFKSTDAAVSAARSIGLKSVTVQIA